VIGWLIVAGVIGAALLGGWMLDRRDAKGTGHPNDAAQIESDAYRYRLKFRRAGMGRR
jgi:hypothetical protein